MGAGFECNGAVDIDAVELDDLEEKGICVKGNVLLL